MADRERPQADALGREAQRPVRPVADRLRRRPDAPVGLQPERRLADRQRRQRLVEHHDLGAGRRRRAHGALGATLAAQQPRQPVAPRRDQLDDPELQHLPDARHRLHRQRVGAAEERDVGDARERAEGEIDDGDVAEVEPRRRPGIEIADERSHARRTAEDGDQLEAVLARAAPDRHPPRPRHGVDGSERLVRWDALAELRQVEERHRRRPVDHRLRRPWLPLGPGRQPEGGGIGPHRLDEARAGVGGRGHPGS